MRTNKKMATVLAAALLYVSPLQAQPLEPSLPEQLIEGVRSLFGKLFGGGEGASEESRLSTPATTIQSLPSSQPAAAEPPPVAAAAPLPAMQVPARALHDAVLRGDYDATVKLLEQGTDIEAKDPGSGASPLHYAVMKGRMQIVDLLISRGADVNSRTRNRTTPLHTAALYAKKEVAERLLEKKADMNAVSASGSTPLALATAARNHPIATMLRERGAR